MTWDDLELERNCSRCDGTGMYTKTDYNGAPREVRCGDCNATGKVPSDVGEKLIEFIIANIWEERGWLSRIGRR